jgi:signal transduction histidine kinase
VPLPLDEPLAPMPGLGGVPVLVESAAMAGVRAELRMDAGDLPAGIALAVYRIVQESLTNIVKHAAPARAQVVIQQDGGEVRIEVTDDGPGVRTLPGTAAGHGLVGMRERVMMYGGEFTAGPRAEGGFAVSARLPCDRSNP